MVARVLREHPGYTLKLMGHSLGAGTAALAAMLINNSPEVPFGCPLPQGTHKISAAAQKL